MRKTRCMWIYIRTGQGVIRYGLTKTMRHVFVHAHMHMHAHATCRARGQHRVARLMPDASRVRSDTCMTSVRDRLLQCNYYDDY